MKNHIINLFTCLGVASRRSRACLAVALRRRVLSVLFAILTLIPAGRLTAQTFTTLYSFTPTSPDGNRNSDGAAPYAGLITNSSGNTVYGTTQIGGIYGNGTVFAVNTDGTGFTNLHSFTGGSNGGYPRAGLVLSGNTLYGTTLYGGSLGYGMVFAVNTDGTGFTNLHSFTSTSDGANPYAGLVLSGHTLYGTAYVGGSSGYGTVFAVNTDGTGFTNLHNFTSFIDGGYPYAGLVLSGNTLYGTAVSGGSSDDGTVFKINTDGSGFTNLHNFDLVGDGANPYAGLILSGNILYGTAAYGGISDAGTVFAINTDGTGFTNLHNLTGGDGANPYAVVLSGHTLYATAYGGGSSGYGAVFAVNTDGSDVTNLHSFTYSDGANPLAALILSGNTVYGTTSYGGSLGKGTVFAVNTDGTGFTNLHSFTTTPPIGNNSDGANPYAGLIGTGNTRYGTASLGGASGNGTVFAVNVDGTGFTNLHSFTYSDGAVPWAGLILSGHTLYGTAMEGGRSGNGTVFAINTDGTGFTNLHVFTARDASEINADGACPNAGLILSGHYLYGTASKGGSSGAGTVFRIATNGVGFLNLHSFNGSDGADPVAGLTLSGRTLYGTAAYGGISGNGTVFRVNIDGTGFMMLYSFQQTYLQGGGCYCPLGYQCFAGTCLYNGGGGIGIGPGGGGHGCMGFCGE